MPEINIKIRDKRAGGTGTVICGNSDYTVAWDLDQEWEPYSAKTMRVNLADGTYQDVVFTGNTAALPVLSTPGWASVGLYAGDLHTSRAADLRVLPSVTTPGGAPADPPESVYDQLMELIKDMGGASEEDIAKVVATYLAEHPVEETDPTVPAWAKVDSKPTYTAAEVGALSADTLQTATNAALAQAKASGAFDGADGNTGPAGIVISSTQPTGDTHPVWLNPDGDADGEDFSLGISSATVGQIAKISAVDENGVPTAWGPADMPSGGGGREWVKIGEVTTAEDTTEAMHIKFTKDVNGNLLSLKGVLIIGRALFSDANQHWCTLTCNDNPYGGNANYFLHAPVLRNGQFFTIYSEFLRADGVNSVAFTAFNAGNVKQYGGCESTINTWSPGNEGALQFPMRGVNLTIPDSGLLAGSKFEFWGVKA